MQQTKLPVRNMLCLFLTATIWGTAFVAQSVGMDHVGAFTFSGTRSLVGGLVLIPVIFLLRKIAPPSEEAPKDRKTLIVGGICCGVLLFAASNFQQFGIKYTTVGKAGFITACYIVLVPILGMFLKKPCSRLVWAAVALAVAGLYLLCIKGDFTIGLGDGLVLVCAFLFAMHILVIDYFAPKTDGVAMSCIQFWVCGILSTICAFLFEEPQMSSILEASTPILYAGVMSCGVAYTLQIVGQKNMNPTVASLIMSLESCISVLAGWAILGQKLSAKELLGCVLMFAAVVLAQLPEPKTWKRSLAQRRAS